MMKNVIAGQSLQLQDISVKLLVYYTNLDTVVAHHKISEVMYLLLSSIIYNNLLY